MAARSTRRIRLLKDPLDRQRVNELSLQGFEMMLDKLHAQPGAVIVSASVLNHADRQPNRLADRIRAVEQRPQWTYRRIQRPLNPIESILLGRLMFAWPVRTGERYWKVISPGIVVWRAGDPVPNTPI